MSDERISGLHKYKEKLYEDAGVPNLKSIISLLDSDFVISLILCLFCFIGN